MRKKLCDTGRSGFPKFGGQDRIVSVNEKIPHSDNPCPWNFWMGFLKIGSDPVGRFTDQFKATFEGGLELPVIVASDGMFAPRLRDPACAGDFSPQLRPRRRYGVETQRTRIMFRLHRQLRTPRRHGVEAKGVGGYRNRPEHRGVFPTVLRKGRNPSQNYEGSGGRNRQGRRYH